MFFRKRELQTKEYLELKKDLESLRIRFEGLQLEFELIVKKLKVKYKLTTRDKEETEDFKNNVLLPEG